MARLARVLIPTMLLCSPGMVAGFAQDGEALCHVDFVTKGALSGQYLRSLAVLGTNVVGTTGSDLRFFSYDARGENPQITGSIEGLWDNDDVKLVIAGEAAPESKRLYAQGPERLVIVDINTHEIIGDWMAAENERLLDLAINGSTGYLVSYRWGDSSPITEMRVINFSNPRSPIVLGTYLPPLWDTWVAIAVAGNYAYLGLAERVEVIDVSNPAAPTLVSVFTAESFLSSITISGERAFLGGDGEFYILDVTNPRAPQLQTKVKTDGLRVETIENPPEINHGNLLFVTDLNQKGSAFSETSIVKVFDLSTAGAPQRVGTFGEYGATNVVGTVASNGLFLSIVSSSDDTALNISRIQVQPRLVIRQEQSLVTLTWGGDGNFILEQSAAPSGPWTHDANLKYESNGGLSWLQLDRPTTNTFFRLVENSQ